MPDPREFFPDGLEHTESPDTTRDDFDRNGMCKERYDELMDNPQFSLTEGEIRAGWYWSPSWDGLLIHKTWHEARFDYPTEGEMP